MIVADTNVLAYLWIDSPHSSQAEAVQEKDPEWVSPFLWRSEFRNVLASNIRAGTLTLSASLRIMDNVESWMSEHEYDVQSDHVLRLVARSRATSYDCEFVALAEHLCVPLVSNDRALGRAFPEVVVTMREFLLG